MNNLRRLLLKPIMTAFRGLRMICFRFTKDAKFLRSLKNTHIGERCFILGNGPSLNVSDINKLKKHGEFTFACNRIFYIFDKTEWRPDIYLAIDNDVLKAERSYIEKLNLPNMFVNITSKAYAHYTNKKIHFINMYGPYIVNQSNWIKKKVSTDISKYFSMSYTVTCLAIEMAAYMGFTDIYLLGCDHTCSKYMKADGKLVTDNTVKDYFGNVKATNYTLQFTDSTTSCYQCYQENSLKLGIKIYNATRGGKLEVFKRVDFDQLFGED